MKTLFTMGFSSVDFWNRPRPSLGSPLPFLGQVIPTGDLDENQKNTVYAELKSMVDKGLEIDNWIHQAGPDGQKAAMGADYDRFRAFVDYAANLANDVYPIYQRLQSDNQEDWWIMQGDDDKISLMNDAVNNAYKLYTLHVKNQAAPPAPVLTPTPKPAGVAPPPPRPPATPAAPTKGITPAPTILGMNPNDLLLGGGIAVGVGILIYALA